MNNIDFDLKQLPIAYFNDNPKANGLRKQLIANNVGIDYENQTNLEKIFFSDENIAVINKGIIYNIFTKTKGQYKIAEQSTRNLTIVMRYVFINEARYLPFDIPKQIRELNCRVIDNVVPKIITEITQRTEYLRFISTPRIINELPKSSNR